MNADKEGSEGVVGEVSGNGVELGGGHGQSVAVRELVEAGYDSLLQIRGRRRGGWLRRAAE